MSLSPLTIEEFTGHPKLFTGEIEATHVDRQILRRGDEIIREALKFANCLRASGHDAKAIHDLAQLLGAAARNDRKPPPEVKNL